MKMMLGREVFGSGDSGEIPVAAGVLLSSDRAAPAAAALMKVRRVNFIREYYNVIERSAANNCPVGNTAVSPYTFVRDASWIVFWL